MSAFMTLTQAASLRAFGEDFDAAEFAARELSEHEAGLERYVAAMRAAYEPAQAAGLSPEWHLTDHNPLLVRLPAECLDVYAVAANNRARADAFRRSLRNAMNEIREAAASGVFELFGCVRGQKRKLEPFELASFRVFVDHLILDGFHDADDGAPTDVILSRPAFEAWRARSMEGADDKEAFPASHETKAVAIIAAALRQDGDGKRPKAAYFALLEEHKLRVSDEGKEKRVWPAARIAADLPVKARAGRRPNRGK